MINHGDIWHLSLLKSTARRHRPSARSEQAASIRKDFTRNFSQIKFDGKLLSDLVGGFGKVNRLAVVLDQEEDSKILAVTKTSGSTGKYKQRKSRIFSTTTPLMACRHHILELVVGSAFMHLFGETNSPKVTLFKIMKSSTYKTSWSLTPLLKKVQKMALFVVFVYLSAWFSGPFLVSATANDLTLLHSSQKVKSVDWEISTITTAVLTTDTPGNCLKSLFPCPYLIKIFLWKLELS